MPEPLAAATGLITIGGITLTRAVSWTTKLAKAWKGLQSERRKNLIRAAEDFGDLEALAKIYIEPDCQRDNPADAHEEDPKRTFRQPIGPWLNDFLKEAFREHDGSHVLFVLSDAGMGKSSLLMMLKLSHEMKFWPTDVHFELLKIGADTLDRLEEIEDKPHTVALLDALDEDRAAWGRIKIKRRLGELLRATQAFRQVILTCRTQFFPKEVEDERFGRVEVEGFRCNLLYVSPFDDRQTRAYLEKSIPKTWKDRLRKAFLRRDRPRLVRGLEIMSLMGSLRMRPMLLAHVEYLMGAKVEHWDLYTVYDELVNRWLDREVAKRKTTYTRDTLRQACNQVAMLLFQRGIRRILEADLDAYLQQDPTAAPIKSIDLKGRSLLNRTSDGDYRFAHLSIQEFFVAESFVIGEYGSKLQVTDQVLKFIVCGSSITQQPIRTSRLDFTKLDRVDLSNANLINAKLNNADLTGADLTSANLIGANLISADLSNANLSNANLSNANLSRADLSNATFIDTKLINAKLSGANLSDADLSRAKLSNAKLTSANLHRANLNSAKLISAKLISAKLSGANLDRADLSDADLSDADLSEANLHRANLRDADLIRTDLTDAKLTDAKLTDAKLTSASLSGANLHRADLREANLREANLREANLRGANLSRADLSDADLSGVLSKLTQEQINSARGNITTKLPADLSRPFLWT